MEPQVKDETMESNPPSNGVNAPWWNSWKFMVPAWVAVAGIIYLGLHNNVDERVIAGIVFVLGILSNAFAWMLGIIALAPVVGPFVVKILTFWFIWLVNAIGYVIAYIAIRRGYSKDVLTYRGLTIATIIGIVIGYVLGKVF